MFKWSFSFPPETLADSGIRTKSGLNVLLEGWSNLPNTLPYSQELLDNDCTAENVKYGQLLTRTASYR